MSSPNIWNAINVENCSVLVVVSSEPMSTSLSSLLGARRHPFKNLPAAPAPTPVSQGTKMLKYQSKILKDFVFPVLVSLYLWSYCRSYCW